MSLTGFIGLVEAAAPFSYLAILLIATAEVTLFLGFVPNLRNTIIASGFVAQQGGFNIISLALVVFIGTIVGNLISYFLGKKYGNGLLVKHSKKLKIKEKHINILNDYMKTHFGKTMLIGRFNSVTRTFTPFLAGSSGITMSRFLFHVLINAVVWTTIFIGIGYGIGIGYTNLGTYVAIASVMALLIITAYFMKFMKSKYLV